jgi:heme exporter protein CcmD
VNEKYALYVWSSYGLSLAVLLWNMWAPRLRRNQLRRQLAEAPEDVG